MKVVLQRVKTADVAVSGEIIGRIDTGYVLLVGYEQGDHVGLNRPMLEKICQLKLFADDSGRFALSLQEIDGQMLIVSQFTLSAELKKGKKPSFSKAMDSITAEILYNDFVQAATASGNEVQTGRFGEMMQVRLQNDGPVTILIDSHAVFPSLHTEPPIPRIGGDGG
jgi:D-aminoacyl-tRNA deacylase